MDDLSNNSTPDDEIEIRPGMEPLTPEEMERFLARARAQGRTLTSEEQYAIFGPPPEKPAPQPQYTDVAEMEAAPLTAADVDALTERFFGELNVLAPPAPRLIQGVIFDFDYTLAQLTRPIDELMAEGARQAEAYMRASGMTLPDDFWQQIVEARRFAEEKSEEEQEEHIADDAMSFLLQFFGYPASKMDPAVLRRAVDIFYAPEMTAWQPRAGAVDLLRQLHAEGYKLALLANYNCDRVFQRMVDYAGFRPHLDMVLSSSSVERRKPDEVFFNLVLERWDALPHEVIVVGDSLLHDIKGGLDLGAFTVQMQGPTSAQIAYQNEQAADQVHPDAVIDDLTQLPALVQQWAVG